MYYCKRSAWVKVLTGSLWDRTHKDVIHLEASWIWRSVKLFPAPPQRPQVVVQNHRHRDTGPYKSPGYVRGMITSGIMIGALIKRCIHLKGLCHDGRMLVYIKKGGQTCQFVGNWLLVRLHFIQRNSWTNFCKNFSPIKNIYLSWFRCVYFPDWSFVLRVAVTAYISVLNLLWCCSPLHMVAVLHQRK